MSSEDEEDWQEAPEEEESDNLRCLCCPEMLTSVANFRVHLDQMHDWRLAEFVGSPGQLTNMYDFIRFVNYVRSENPKHPPDVFSDASWTDEERLKPVLEDDAVLHIDLEALGISFDDEMDTNAKSKETMINELRAENAELKEIIQKMRGTMKQILSGNEKTANEPVDRSACNLHSNGSDNSYFQSYSHYGIHAEMLADIIRTGSYGEFIEKNAESLFQSRRVLDLGCGTGILSMFAARAGSDRVIGVDCADIIYQAMDIVRENKLHNKITLVKGKLEEVEMPFDKVDVIVSEWMGYFLLFESMLDSVLFARDRYLRPGGSIFPRHYSLHLVGCDDAELRRKNVDFWTDVYGFRMTCMPELVLSEAQVTVVAGSAVATEPSCVRQFDLLTAKLSDSDFRSDFALLVTKERTQLTAIVGYFDTEFDREAQHLVSFSTSPLSTPTHWKQTVFLLKTPIDAKQGDVINGMIDVRKNRKDVRGLEVRLQLGNQSQLYIMD